MTVAELIEKLSHYRGDMPVVVGGFDEWGYDDIGLPSTVTLVPVAPASHGPAYEDPEFLSNGASVTGERFTALCLDR